MSKVTLKAYVPEKSLAAKIKGVDVPSYVAIRFNPETNTFKIGDVKIKGKHTDPSNKFSPVQAMYNDIILDDQETIVTLKNGIMWDLDIPEQKLSYQIALDSGWLARSKRELNPALGHRFYIEDEELEAEVASNKADLFYEAMEIVREMNGAEKRDLARLMGQYVTKMSENKIDGFLKKTAMDSPEKIINLVSHKDYKHRVFIKKLRDAGILIEDNGKYRYEQQLIGVDLDTAVFFLKDPANADIVTQWGRFLNGGNSVDVASEVVNKIVPKKGGKRSE